MAVFYEKLQHRQNLFFYEHLKHRQNLFFTSPYNIVKIASKNNHIGSIVFRFRN